MFTPSGPELIIVIFVILLLFGAKKLPELAQGLGKGIREFKKATHEDDTPTKVENNSSSDKDD